MVIQDAPLKRFRPVAGRPPVGWRRLMICAVVCLILIGPGMTASQCAGPSSGNANVPLRADESSGGEAAAATRGRWLSGKAVREALAEMAAWSAEGLTLQTHLDQWQTQSGVRVIRDRRVSPDQRVRIPAVAGSRAQLLNALVAALPGVSWTLVDDHVYVGPSHAALRLPLLMDRQRKLMQGMRRQLPAATASRVMTPETRGWPSLTSPRDILAQAARAAGIQLDYLEAIPHDVWQGDQWMGMTFGEQATLILNQFDLLLVSSGEAGGLAVTAIDRAMQADFQYEFSPDQKDAIQQAATAAVPAAAVRWSRGTAHVTASLDDHLWFQSRFHNAQFGGLQSHRLTESLTTRRFTLTVEHATLEAVLAGFQENGIEIEVVDRQDPAVRAVLQTPVSIQGVSRPGQAFFPEVFGEYFHGVEVLDDKVVLSGPR